MKTLRSVFFVLLLLFSFSSPHASRAMAGFGSGLASCTPAYQQVTLVSPTIISGAQCSTSGIQAALDKGGHILLNCGSTPIPINTTLKLKANANTVLDGGGVVTLDGQNKTRILQKDWHDPALTPSVTVTIQNIRLIRGKAPSGGSTGDISGGAIMAGHPGTRLHIINSTFESNATTDIHTTDNQGGAIFAHNAYETVISGAVFRSNQAGNGGAVGAIASGIWIENSVFESNRALDDAAGGIVRGYGGALHLDGVYNNYNPNSSRLYYVCGSRFTGNQAVRGGGALAAVVSDGAGTLADFAKNTFINNTASGFPDPNKPGDYQFGQGGAIYHVEDDLVNGSSENNFALQTSTFQGNQARKQGGAVWVSILGSGKMSNVTFESNSTSAPFNTVGQGGAVVISKGTFGITNATFANNHAAYQGGALFGGGESNLITLTNTIFFNNTLNEQTLPSETKWQGYHTNRTMLDGGSNIQYPRMKPTYNNDVNNLITASPTFADPLLKPLADNGGPNMTMALKVGSPAINTGNAAACPVLDQRGVARQGRCDIGAYEFIAQTNFLFLPALLR